MALGEADTCRKFIVPLLQQAGLDDEPHAINEQRTFTDGRVIFVGGKVKRGKQKRADYLLRYRSDFPIAVVETKARYKSAADGVQQANKQLWFERLQAKVWEMRAIREQAARDASALLPAMLHEIFGDGEA